MNTPPLPTITLPTVTLLVTAIGTAAMAGAGWTFVTLLGPWDTATALTGLLAIGIVAAVAICGILVMRPWRARSILSWGGVLIAASIGRAVVAIGICLLLYFAARQSVGPLLIGALAGLVAVLIGETTIAAKQFKQATA
ncbi:MAG: hypothetical protein QGI75_02200 [Phycisphaerales bacterium]|nr:hypothetical protein [Phycisphaerales bacterium]MDP6890685.1 hypothetical protein [Phycisphaerales bacterium]